MAVGDLGFLEILIPLHDAAGGIDPRGCQIGTGGIELLRKLRLKIQDACGGGGVFEQVARDLLVKGGTGAQRVHPALAVLVLRGIAVLG